MACLGHHQLMGEECSMGRCLLLPSYASIAGSRGAMLPQGQPKALRKSEG